MAYQGSISSGRVEDAPANEVNGCSGNIKYYFSGDGGTTWLPEGGQTSNSYSLPLEENTIYNFKIKVEDEAGNAVISDTKEFYNEFKTRPLQML